MHASVRRSQTHSGALQTDLVTPFSAEARADMVSEHSNTARLPSDSGGLLADLWRSVRVSAALDISHDLLRPVARQVSLAAHEAGLRAEQLIVAVKASWIEHNGSFESRRRQWVLSEMISLCIEAFYRTLHESRSTSA